MDSRVSQSAPGGRGLALSPAPFPAGGQKARVVFAELSCREPDVLILVRAGLGAGLGEGRGVARCDHAHVTL